MIISNEARTALDDGHSAIIWRLNQPYTLGEVLEIEGYRLKVVGVGRAESNAGQVRHRVTVRRITS